MKKILQLTKAIILTLAAVIMLLNTNVLTAYAQVMLPGMTKTEYGIMMLGTSTEILDHKEAWVQSNKQPGYPYREVKKTYTRTLSNGMIRETEGIFLDCYLTDYIETHEESEWPSFVIKGTDGVPFYLFNGAECFVKYCYDEKSGWWFRDDAYESPKVPFYGWSDAMIDKAIAEVEQMIEDLKEDIANGDVIENGTPVKPVIPDYINDVIDSESPDVPTKDLNDGTLTYPDGRVKYPDGHTKYPDGRAEYPKWHDDHYDKHIIYPDGHVEYYCDETIIRIEYPDGRVEYPDGRVEYPNYADVNTLGAAVKLKTDCIKVKTNKKGVVAQKPLPGSVKVNKKALKRNKTYTVSYEKYTDYEWHEVSAVTDEGIYRLVITGQNGYEGVYTKKLYVTADKTIKAMSSVSVKVDKMSYTGNPIEAGVIRTAKIGRRILVEDSDYTVTYNNNTDIGIGQVTLTAKEGSGLLGTKTVNFTITGNKITKAKVDGLQALTYNPNTEMVQDFGRVRLTYNGKTIGRDKDYTVSYVNNTKAGTAKIIFTGKGIYNGTLTKKFKINKAALNERMLDEVSKNIEVTYTGKALKPDVTLKDGDTVLKKGTDYTVAYKNNVKVSTDVKPAQIIIKGKGNYTGSFKVDFAVIANDNTGNSNAKNLKPDADASKAEDPETEEPTTEETVTDEPTEEERATDEPTEEEPATDELTEEEPSIDEPAGEEPDADYPTEEEPATDDPTKEEPTGDQPATDEPTEEEPDTDEPTEEEPDTDEPTEKEPVADEPTEEEPDADEPTSDESVTDEPTEEAPVTDELTEKESVTNELTEEFVTDEPAME